MAQLTLQSSNVFSYMFNGTGNTHFHYLVAGNNNPVLNIGGASWTAECWINPVGPAAGGANFQTIFTKRQGGTTTCSYSGYLASGNGFMEFYNGTEFIAVNAKPTNNAWNHLAWVFNQGANLRMFLNGVNVFTTTSVTSIANIDSQFFIGQTPGQNHQFFGEISNFRIVRGQALYSGESFQVSTFPVQLPNNAIGPHAFGSNVAASLTGNVIVLTCNDQVIKSNGNTVLNAFSVNGDVYPHFVDNKDLTVYSISNFNPATIPSANSAETSGSFLLTTDSSNLNLPSGDFTIECWVYTTTNVASGNAFGDILNKGGAINIAFTSFAISTRLGNVYFSGSNTNARIDIGGDGLNGVGGNVHRGYIGAWTPNTWNHVAITRTGTTYNGFLNGVLGYTETTANTPYNSTGRGIVLLGAFENSSNTWTAGGMAQTTRFLNGYIADARITRRSLYPANTNFTPPQSPLQLHPNTVFLLKGPIPTDVAGSVTISSNGSGALFYSTFNPYTANATVNGVTNLTSSITSQGIEQPRIYNKFDYTNFGQMINIYPTLGVEPPRIYNKFDYANFAIGMSNVQMQTQGAEQGRIYNKFDYANYAIGMSNVQMQTQGAEQGRIYNKFDYANYASLGRSLVIYTVGQEQGRLYHKIVSNNDFAYMPVPTTRLPSITSFEYWS